MNADHCSFNLFGIGNIEYIMQCYHHRKCMNKINISAHRNILHVNMKDTFLFNDHVVRCQIHSAHHNSQLIVFWFFKKNNLVFLLTDIVGIKLLRKEQYLKQKQSFFSQFISAHCPYYVETSPLIYIANQITGFYIKATLGRNGLIYKTINCQVYCICYTI